MDSVLVARLLNLQHCAQPHGKIFLAYITDAGRFVNGNLGIDHPAFQLVPHGVGHFFCVGFSEFLYRFFGSCTCDEDDNGNGGNENFVNVHFVKGIQGVKRIQGLKRAEMA